MNGSGWTMAALHSENGLLIIIKKMSASAQFTYRKKHHYCINMDVTIAHIPFAPKVSGR